MVKYTLFGESHGEAIGVVLENLPPGIKIDMDFINKEMGRRKANDGGLTTSRIEPDKVEIISGVFREHTTGAPLCGIIRNQNVISRDYKKIKDIARPSHADYTGYVKYQGYNDYRGGGHFSGRVTAALVFAGALARLILKEKGIYIGSHILQILDIRDTKFDKTNIDQSLIDDLANKQFAVINKAVSKRMQDAILSAKYNQTSIGGIIECAVINMDCGIGSPGLDSIESTISKHIFGIGAVKGIEFGAGFDFCNMYGHEANDEMYIKDGKVMTYSNNNGGILGGISNGMPITFNVAIKPTPSISRKQRTVDFNKMDNCEIEISGRHDPCILSRAVVVIECATALALCEIL